MSKTNVEVVDGRTASSADANFFQGQINRPKWYRDDVCSVCYRAPATRSLLSHQLHILTIALVLQSRNWLKPLQ